MILEQHYLDCLSQASYLIADPSTGRAVVVDPRRDIEAYLESAEAQGLRIELIIETHFHADFLSGHLELAEATGAEIAYGDRAVTDFASRKLADGERISLGEVELEILHTPGHTPESISVVVRQSPDDEPHAVLTGDTLFIGDVGRPDLLSSVGASADDLASDLYDSLHTRLLALPDDTILYPGHGAGSSCGKNLSSDTSCTIGRQRENNYALAPMSRDEFIAAVTEGQTAPPAYFSHDADLNRRVRGLYVPMPVAALSADDAVAAQADGAVLLDVRDPVTFAQSHLTGSLNIGLSGRFAEYAGAILAPDDRVIIVAEPGAEGEARMRLARIGFDNVIGHVAGVPEAVRDSPAARIAERVNVAELAELLGDPRIQLVDVRQPGETEGGVIDGAICVPLTRLNAEMGQLDPDRPTIVYCAGGFRSSIAASRLASTGFGNVKDLVGGFSAWHEAHATV